MILKVSEKNNIRNVSKILKKNAKNIQKTIKSIFELRQTLEKKSMKTVRNPQTDFSNKSLVWLEQFLPQQQS